MLVHGGADGEVRNGAQSSHVESTMMGRTVFAYQTGTVPAEYDMKVQQGHVVNNVVVSTLRESTIDIAERYQSVFSHTS